MSCTPDFRFHGENDMSFQVKINSPEPIEPLPPFTTKEYGHTAITDTHYNNVNNNADGSPKFLKGLRSNTVVTRNVNY